MRTIGVVSTSRADYGIYRPVLRAIEATDGLHARLLVSGSHLSSRFGLSVREIEEDGFEIAERVEIPLEADGPGDIAGAMGRAVSGFAEAFGRCRPDLVAVLGDRYEMHAAALAALPFKIPVAHLHGGEVTEGAIDDSLRHAMTKLSHLHFVATEEYGRRVVQLGEEPWRVTISGAPALDNLRELSVPDSEELERIWGVRAMTETLLVTFHPATLEYEEAATQTEELLAALEESGRPLLFTMPNADTGGLAIRSRIEAFVAGNPRAILAETLGTRGYFGAMAVCAAMVGNSSSALIEAPSFALPAVNVGSRQRGRVRGLNVVDTGNGREEIAGGLARALDPSFRESLRGRPNPYGDGSASARIVSRLREVPLDQRLVVKRFHDLPVASGA